MHVLGCGRGALQHTCKRGLTLRYAEMHVRECNIDAYALWVVTGPLPGATHYAVYCCPLPPKLQAVPSATLDVTL
jgi:hypothetical protein